MKNLLKAIQDIINGVKYRSRVIPSLSGKQLVIYANDQVIVLDKDRIVASVDGTKLMIETTLPDGKARRTEVLANTEDEAKKLMRKLFRATSPIYVRALRFSAYVIAIGYTIVLFGNTEDPNAKIAQAQPDLSAYTAQAAQQQSLQQQSLQQQSLQQQSLQQQGLVPQAPQQEAQAEAPTSANDMGFPPVPFSD